MTPQEKADELVKKYLTIEMQMYINDLPYMLLSKQCALIAVDEVLKETSNKNSKIGRLGLSDTEYWEQVKKELI
jgi:hypothetical protein